MLFMVSDIHWEPENISTPNKGEATVYLLSHLPGFRKD